MNCAEIRLRLVDPESALQGGHAPVVSHLQECASCREAARAYAALERLLVPVDAEPPRELDQRIHRRLVSTIDRPASIRPPRPNRLPVVGVAAGAVAVAFVAGYLLLRPAAARPPANVVAAPTPATADSAIPGWSSLTAPITEDERVVVGGLRDVDFLGSLDALAGLDPFFPTDIAAGELFGPALPTPPPAPPPTPLPAEQLAERVMAFRRLPKASQERLIALNGAFANYPLEQQQALERRWVRIAGLGPEEAAGARRLGVRVRSLEPEERSRLTNDVRKLEALPPAQRISRWRALPFSSRLTGQEKAAAERLLETEN